MDKKRWFSLLKDTFNAWREDKASRLGAALAYYTIFSIGPLLLVIIAVVGFVLGRQATEGTLVGTISGVVGSDGAKVIQDAVKNASKPGAGILASVIGLVTLLLGASGIFGQLQDALNTVWKVEPPEGGGIIGMLKARIPPFLMLLGCGLLLLASLVANSVLSVLGNFLSTTLPGGALLWQVVNFVITLGVMTLLFAMIFKVLPITEIAWKDVWVGAALTSFLFTVGQFALAFYLSISNVGSPYGAAGSIVVVLVWIYYSAQILLFGAEFTRVYSERHGSRAKADEAESGKPRPLKESPWFGKEIA
jgi:membrane protein